jgi:hypothetical protein
VHARAHGLNQLLHFAAANFFDTQLAGALPQHGVSSLDDFKFHGIHDFRSQTGA